MSILSRVFLWVLKSSLNASIIAVFLIIIKGLFRKKISPRIHHVLWLIVLVRLLIPFLPESNLSVLNILQQNPLNIIYNHGDNIVSEIDTTKDNSNTVGIVGENTNNNFNEHINNEQLQNTNNGELIVFKGNTRISKKINILSIIWLSGFLLITILILTSTIRTKNKVIKLKKVKDAEILWILDSCKKTIGINKEIPLYTGNYFNSPCILGIFKPCIYYPKNKFDNINDNNLYHIFLHELAHFKRKDQLNNLVCVLTLSLHWFNPLIWLVIRNMRVDRELACDAYVLNTIGESEAISYGMTIINFLENSSLNKNKPSLLYFNETSCKLERRIKMIRGFKKSSYKISMLTIVVGILISSVTLTNAITPTYNNDIKPINSINKLKGFDEILEDDDPEDSIYLDLNNQEMVKVWNKEVKFSDELTVEINGILADRYKSLVFYTVKSNNIEAYDSADFDFNLTSKSPLAFDKRGYIGGSGSWIKEENEFKIIDTIYAKLDPVDDNISFSIDYLDDNIEPIIVNLPFTEDDFVANSFEKDLDINIQKESVNYKIVKIYSSPMQTLLFIEAQEKVKDYLKQGNILDGFSLFYDNNELKNFEGEGSIDNGIFKGFQCFSPLDSNINSLVLQYEDIKHKIDLSDSASSSEEAKDSSK